MAVQPGTVERKDSHLTMLDWLAEDLIEVLDHFNFDFRIPDPKTDT
jgi:hypothetical protein